MSGRLVVISNRLPMGDNPSGGLVVALHDALTQSGGCWIGAHPETGSDNGQFEQIESVGYKRLAFRLSDREFEQYYLGYANSVLWPLCHRRPDLVSITSDAYQCYEEVNRRVARMVASELDPDDLVWVHDYHFIPLARELRALGVENRIGMFLHIPFPVLADLSILPDPEEFADNLAHYNLIGLQTRGDVARCLEMFRDDPRAEFMTDASIKFRDRRTMVRSFPIGIDVAGFKADAEQEMEDPFGASGPDLFAIGVDRLDYSKGLPNRFRAFGRYLELRPPEMRPCLVQIAPPTRQEVRAYQDITEELQGLTGQINGRFAELDWTPIRFINRSVDRSRLARLYRQARSCLVTSLADGMNLVAKEFIAAQDPADPGVLILSRFAGVAEDMVDALLVNPYDIDDMARAIDRAFQMPLEERQERHRRCLAVVENSDVAHWSANFVHVLQTEPPTRDFVSIMQWHIAN
ncbi:alpha,alpha-trehalose-phosphate synthase (UDP-forming) [Novosphingobium aquimarinum]|uniref:alpha,alpha-trehalose-phosphate synthase (UDP-forming) n=1 Tax=Novosphingobium aquimarinum TaxID=2682494 RepID=UPI0012EB6EC9|nr:trehalose-6-phosphate synthase [Novosphingobium aquimarinum]